MSHLEASSLSRARLVPYATICTPRSYLSTVCQQSSFLPQGYDPTWPPLHAGTAVTFDQSAPPPSLLPENIARGGAHSNRHQLDAGAFSIFSGKYHMRHHT